MGSTDCVQFLDLLSDVDRAAAENLRANVSSRFQRLRRMDGFRDSLARMRLFCERHDHDDWKRFMVCGVCWLPDRLAVNNTQLQLFTRRCKSTINDIFAQLRYRTIPINQQNKAVLLAKIPYLRSHYDEMRKWTFRTPEGEERECQPIVPRIIPQIAIDCRPDQPKQGDEIMLETLPSAEFDIDADWGWDGR
jgi:hypothetical protein